MFSVCIEDVENWCIWLMAAPNARIGWLVWCELSVVLAPESWRNLLNPDVVRFTFVYFKDILALLSSSRVPHALARFHVWPEYGSIGRTRSTSKSMHFITVNQVGRIQLASTTRSLPLPWNSLPAKDRRRLAGKEKVLLPSASWTFQHTELKRRVPKQRRPELQIFLVYEL